MLAFGNVTRRFAPEPRNAPLWGSFHFLSVGLAIGSAALVARYVEARIVWSLVPFLATAIYLLVLAAQFTAAEGNREP
jgi:hypothetical protein